MNSYVAWQRVVDCIYGEKLNLMLLTIPPQYFFLALSLTKFFLSFLTILKTPRVKFMFQICLLFISFHRRLNVHFKIIHRLKYILKMPRKEKEVRRGVGSSNK